MSSAQIVSASATVAAIHHNKGLAASLASAYHPPGAPPPPPVSIPRTTLPQRTLPLFCYNNRNNNKKRRDRSRGCSDYYAQSGGWRVAVICGNNRGAGCSGRIVVFHVVASEDTILSESDRLRTYVRRGKNNVTIKTQISPISVSDLRFRRMLRDQQKKIYVEKRVSRDYYSSRERRARPPGTTSCLYDEIQRLSKFFNRTSCETVSFLET